MKDSAFIIVGRKGIVRLVKGKPTTSGKRVRPRLESGEYAVLLSLIVPDSVFHPVAAPEATITIPETSMIAPPVSVAIEPFTESRSPETPGVGED